MQENGNAHESVETIRPFISSEAVNAHSQVLIGKESNSKLLNNCAKALPKSIQETVLKELDVCSNAAEKYPNNYNAWSHRIWLIRSLCQYNEEVYLRSQRFRIFERHTYSIT